MPKERHLWRVCYAHEDIWDCIGSRHSSGG